jgi:hypothetical protein
MCGNLKGVYFMDINVAKLLNKCKTHIMAGEKEIACQIIDVVIGILITEDNDIDKDEKKLLNEDGKNE